MAQETYTNGSEVAFEAVSKAAFSGKEHYLVEFAAGTRKVQLLTTGHPIGTYVQDLQGGTEVTVRLCGSPGTSKVKLSGTVAHLARVKGASGGTCVAATTTGDRAIGILISPVGGGVSGDIVEILNRVEVAP